MKSERKYLANRLRKCRRVKGFTQQYVAKLLNIKSATRISEWERGKRRPSLEKLVGLSVVYNTLIDHLYLELRKKEATEIAKRLIKYDAKRKKRAPG